MAYNFLLVDDSSIVRKVLTRTFGMTKIPVATFYEAANGKEALEILHKEWIDLVFLDINMPVMDGLQFMEALRADQEIKEMPVVVISTEGSAERRTRLEELGVRAYLRKPATPEAIITTVSDVLGGKHE